MTRTMKHMTVITPICFMVNNEDGFMELCKYLHCIPMNQYTELLRNREREKTSTLYPYTLLHVENDNEETSNEEFSLSMPIREIEMSEMEYPCIITMVDDTFECNSYTFYVKQISSELAAYINEVK